MKNLFLAILPILAVSSSYAQNTPWSQSDNLGVGTLSPGVKLTTRSNTNALPATSGTGQPGGAFRVEGGDNAVIDFGAYSINTWLQATDKTALQLKYNLNLNPNGGNVGIGTINPGHTLEINGNIGGRSQMGNGSTGQLYEIVPYEIASHANAGWTGTMFGIRSGGMSNTSVPLTQNLATTSPAYQQAWAMTFSTDKDQANGAAFQIWTGDASNPGTPMSELFRIKSNGYVGIGTTQPNQKLTVAGTVYATEVLVDQKVPQPDYVFDKNYELASLKDVKSYIGQNHHLSEIPAAVQVAKEGINLGEMNAKLLKKIEELTLYLIQQNEDLTQQKKDSESKLTSQQKEINDLKKQITALAKAK